MAYKYKQLWESDPELQGGWLHGVGDPYSFGCRCCEKTYALSNMYKSRIVSHSKSQGHIEKLKKWKGHKRDSIQFFNKPAKIYLASAANQETLTEAEETAQTSDAEETGNTLTTAVSTNMRCTTGEIKWILNGIKKGYSYRDFDKDNGLLQSIFCADPISSTFSCGKTKVAYTLRYGIDMYLKAYLMDLIQASPYFSISTDGTYNQELHEEQVDYVVRIFNHKTCRVENYYLKSDWIGHKRGQDILKSFTNSTEDLPMKFCINIGLDNVSSNKVFLGAYEEIRKALELLGLIETGPCFLHGLNRGLINAHKHTDLGVSEFLEGINHSFKKSSSRIEDLLSVSTTKLLPLPYCATRFVENIGPTKRALAILPDLKKYVKKFQPSKEDTKKREKLGKNMTRLVLGTEDKFMPAKLEFFLLVLENHERVQRIYQSEGPMLPMVTEDMTKQLRKMLRIVMIKKYVDKLDTSEKLLTVVKDKHTAKEVGYTKL